MTLITKQSDGAQTRPSDGLEYLRQLPEDEKTAFFMKAFMPGRAEMVEEVSEMVDVEAFKASLKRIWIQSQKIANYFCIVEVGKGYLGLAPKGTLVGDIIACGQGCGALLVLRKEDHHHVFVGPCWVVGLLEGEMTQLVEKGEAKMERIEIW